MSGPIGTPLPGPGGVVSAAAAIARRRHSRCDTLEPKGGTTPDGEELVYCGECMEPLVRWGGGDE